MSSQKPASSSRPVQKSGGDLPLAVFVGQMWWYAFMVLYPAQALKSMGLYTTNAIGHYPRTRQSSGAGQLYCRKYKKPVYLPRGRRDHESIREFDRAAEQYQTFVGPFTQPVYEEAVKVMQPLLSPAARILDTSCGPGAELVQTATLVPDGEIVGIDLSAGMVAEAYANAKRHEIRNAAFFQADVTDLPKHFAGRFDAAYCSFAFHHYSDPVAALKSMHRALRPKGLAFVVDPGAWWFNMLSAPFAKWADPGWVGFHTNVEFEALFRKAGFSDFYWEEILPGIGLSIGSK
jgi:ubiquinone/menaquinone biosynthesis C-methylase UbiE